jgi:MFS family permease
MTKKRGTSAEATEQPKKMNFLLELHIWKSIGRLIFPVLLLTLMLNAIDAFFWTIGPLYAEGFTQLAMFDGLVLTVYMLPSLLVGWFVHILTRHLGKKHTAFLFCSLGSAGLITLPFLTNPVIILVMLFLASSCLALAWPAINGAYADYISEAPKLSTQIEGIEDFFTNIGYVVGPMIAGVLADNFGNAQSFAILGIFCVIASSILMEVVPKHISVTSVEKQVP